MGQCRSKSEPVQHLRHSMLQDKVVRKGRCEVSSDLNTDPGFVSRTPVAGGQTVLESLSAQSEAAPHSHHKGRAFTLVIIESLIERVRLKSRPEFTS